MDKNIKYTNKSFSDLKSSLVEFIKHYFPNTYSDFSEASPGMMFTELGAYVGDVLSFYTDTQIQENFLLLAQNEVSLYNLAYMFGYQPKLSYASSTTITLDQLIPISSSAGVNYPDLDYALTIDRFSPIISVGEFEKFLLMEDVDFRDTGSISVNYYDDDYFLLRKRATAISGEIKTESVTVSDPGKFYTIELEDEKFLKILEIKDQDGNIWYEVPYLAQETIFKNNANPNKNLDGINYLVSLEKVPRRFVSRIRPNNIIEIQFGSGLSTNKEDDEILPIPDNVQLGIVPDVSHLLDNFNKASSLFTKEYGLVPPDGTVFTIKYLSGGGIEANVLANSINGYKTDIVDFKNSAPDVTTRGLILDSFLYYNEIPATGGRSGDSTEEVRLNTMNAYSTQLRAVTKEDYIMRCLNMSSDYGSVAKVFLQQSNVVFGDSVFNPLGLDLYILAYNNQKKLINANTTLKNNLKTYLNEFRMANDTIIIKDAYYINIGVNFELNTVASYNNKEILTNCILALKDYFNIDRWQLNQPIVISEISATLLKVPGVISVPRIEVVNKYSGNYSPYAYDIKGASRCGVIHPSIDPSIFEVRFPDVDLKGRTISSC